jgi:hypothetical protein
MLPANAPSYATKPTTPPKQATIDDYTTRVTLSVDPLRPSYVTIEGTWGDLETYGPAPSILELKTHAGKRWSGHTLTKSTGFALAEGTERLELTVTLGVPGMELTLKVFQDQPKRAPALPPPVPPVIPAAVRAVRPVATPPVPAVSATSSPSLPLSRDPLTPATINTARLLHRPRRARGGRGRGKPSNYVSLHQSPVTAAAAAAAAR